jgi:hypothetical protein
MAPFKVSAPVRAFFLDTGGRAIIRDSSGKVAGFYAPAITEQPTQNGEMVKVIDRQISEESRGNKVQLTLHQATEPVQLCDEAGNVFGYYAPVLPDEAEFVASAFPPPDPSKAGEDPLADLRADFDMAAVEREMASHPPTFTLAEVYEHILAITPEPGWRADLEERHCSAQGARPIRYTI